jgi:hypothetical protein
LTDLEYHEAEKQALKNAITGQDEMIKARDEKIAELNLSLAESVSPDLVLVCILIAFIVGLIGGWYFL